MSFIILKSKKSWFVKIGSFQRGNLDVLLVPVFGIALNNVKGKAYNQVVLFGKQYVLSSDFKTESFYIPDPQDQAVVKTITRKKTGEVLTFVSGAYHSYENGKLVSNLGHWIDTRNIGTNESHWNVPYVKKDGTPIDIEKFLDFVEEQMASLIKELNAIEKQGV